jgi:hypothetical protein
VKAINIANNAMRSVAISENVVIHIAAPVGQGGHSSLSVDSSDI